MGLAATALVTSGGPAQAAFPGSNGRIAFELEGSIYTVDAGGGDRRQLTADSNSHSPSYAPDGRTMVFQRGGDIWTMRPDGSRQRQVTSGAALDVNPSWAPDGTHVVFSRRASAGSDFTLFVLDVGRGTTTRLTSSPDGCAVEPTWSADNRFVVYWDQCPDASGNAALRKVRVSTGAVTTVVGPGGVTVDGVRMHFQGTRPDVTPDGQHVVFLASLDDGDYFAIVISDLSGRNARVVYQTDPLFLYGDPAVSPDGTAVVFAAGNENPQLDSACLVPGCSASVSGSAGSDDYPLRPDWRPVR